MFEAGQEHGHLICDLYLLLECSLVKHGFSNSLMPEFEFHWLGEAEKNTPCALALLSGFTLSRSSLILAEWNFCCP